MDSRTKFYCWLIGKLEHHRMTLQEITDEWAGSVSNTKGTELTTRTFHRYREEIASIFGIEIECDKSNGYRYFIRRDKYADTEISDWLLSSLRIASLGDMLKYHDKVVLEEAPGHTEYLDDIMGAIDKHYALHFQYRTAYGREMEMEIVPVFVRLFHQRWYVIGNLIKDSKGDKDNNKQGSDFNPRVLPFDRISCLEVVCERQLLSVKARQKFKPDNFYDGCFGIIRQGDLKVEKVRIRAFYPENNYIDEVPFHESQTKIRDAEDFSYSDYELHVRLTRDFEQELLWHGRKIIVLSPKYFKDEILSILKGMTESYETGKDMLEE